VGGMMIVVVVLVDLGKLFANSFNLLFNLP
jgi:hypothetical protein